MKKFILLSCTLVLLCGCEQKVPETYRPDYPTMEHIPTAAPTDDTTEPIKTYTEVTETVRLYDLYDPANAGYIPEEKQSDMYGGEYEMAGYGTITDADGVVSFIDFAGNERVLVTYGEGTGYEYAAIAFPVDDSRFVYKCCTEWGVAKCGIYDLSTNTEHPFECAGNYRYVPQFIIGNELYLVKLDFSNFNDAAVVDLNNYEIRDAGIEFGYDRRSSPVYDLSDDGKYAAVFYNDIDFKTRKGAEVYIDIYSTADGTHVKHREFHTDYAYDDETVEFRGDNELYYHAKLYEAEPGRINVLDHLYVVDLK